MTSIHLFTKRCKMHETFRDSTTVRDYKEDRELSLETLSKRDPIVEVAFKGPVKYVTTTHKGLVKLKT